MPKYEIELNKVYQIPKEISIVNYDNKIIVIAPEFANWIILNSPSQLAIFEFLRKGHSIQDSLSNSLFDVHDVNYLVTQLEARKFCDKKVHSSIEDKRGLHLYLTNKCNLSCPHCYMYSGLSTENELTTEEIIKLIKEYKEIVHGNLITISGGEPTIHADFDLIVKTASEMGLEVKVLTNGTLMTPDRINKIAKYIHSVQISIDGYSEESNSIIRGKNNFDKALLAVDLFVKLGVETSIAIAPPIEFLKDHLDEYICFAQELSSKYQGKSFHIKFAEELIHGRNISPSKKFNKEYYELIKKIQEHLYGQDYEVMTFVRTLYNNVIIDNCMFGVFAVASNGDVFFCARIGDLLPVANVRTSTIEEIFEKSSTAEKVTLITNLKPCKECDLRFICGGGCRIEEFPELVKRKSFEGIDIEKIPPKHCTPQIKNKFYDLMIRSNKYMYRPLD